MKPLLSVLALASIFSVGCLNHTYVNRKVQPAANPAYSGWHSHFLFALIEGTPNVDLNQVCPTGVAKITNNVSFLNGLVAAFIGVIYYPTTVKVYCADGMAEARELDVEIDGPALRARAESDPEFERRMLELVAASDEGELATTAHP